MNLRFIGLGGLLGLVIVMFSQLLTILWIGEVVFSEPNRVLLIGEIFGMLIFMTFTSYLIVDEFKNGK